MNENPEIRLRIHIINIKNALDDSHEILRTHPNLFPPALTYQQIQRLYIIHDALKEFFYAMNTPIPQYQGYFSSPQGQYRHPPGHYNSPTRFR